MSSESSAPPRQRLFFALWPDGALRQRFVHWSKRCARPCGGRPVAEENLHITLAFPGAVDAERRDCLEAAADTLAVPGFELSLDRIGYFSRSRVLWLSCSRIPPPLLELAMALNAALPVCGLEPERRPFRPHLTLRRRASRPPPFQAIDPIPWRADAFALVASETLPEGARYHILRRWPLA